MNIEINTQDQSTFYTLKTSHQGFLEGMYLLPASTTHLKHEHRYLPALLTSMLGRSTQKHSEEQVNDLLESKGIMLSASANTHYLIYKFKCRTEDLDLLMSILAEQVMMPALKEDEWESQRSKLLAKMQMVADDTDSLAAIGFSDIVYDKLSFNHHDHPSESIKMIKATNIEQLRSYQASFDPAMGGDWVVAGDFDHHQLMQSVKQHFAVNSGMTLARQYHAPATRLPKQQAKHIEIGAKQSISLRIGQVVDIDIHHEDYLPLMLAIDALGGSFSARLMRTVRDEDGLTYSVGARLGGFTKSEVGAWYVYGAFSPKLLDKGIKSIHKQLKLWKEKGISQSELDERKQGVIGRYLVVHSAPSAIVNDVMNFLSHGFGADELIQYPKRVDAVTLEQVNAAIKKYVDLSQLTQVTAGTKTGG